MIYTVILHNHSYNLPAKTLAVTELLDNAAGVDNMTGLSTRDKYKIVMDAVIDVLGRDNVVEAIGSDKIDEVDLNEITLSFRKIVDAYNKPLEEYTKNGQRANLENLPLEEISKLADAAKAINNFQTIQGGKK